jgi:hypothetical protein
VRGVPLVPPKLSCLVLLPEIQHPLIKSIESCFDSEPRVVGLFAIALLISRSKDFPPETLKTATLQ